MKISDKLEQIPKDAPYFSFEFWPPKTTAGLENLHARLFRMSRLQPFFVTVTWGAGGSTAALSLDLASACQQSHGLTTCLHLTCTNMDKSILDQTLLRARDAGIRNILALRGDPPRGQEYWTPTSEDFVYARDLVRYIKEQHGDYFCIGVAAYPEGHVEGSVVVERDVNIDLGYLAEKVKAGAEFVLTQLFYDTEAFIAFEKELRDFDGGVMRDIPVIPTIMPIQSYQSFRRMTKLCGAFVPPELLARLDKVKGDDEAVKMVGVDVAVEMIQRVYEGTEGRCRGVHLCTLNLEKSVGSVLEKSGLLDKVAEREHVPEVNIVNGQGRTVTIHESAIDDSAAAPATNGVAHGNPGAKSRRTSSLVSDGQNRVVVEEIRADMARLDLLTEAKDAGKVESASAASRRRSNSVTLQEGKSVLGKLATWDEFPNGRWGDARSPAFGELDGYGVTIHVPPQEALQLWQHPTDKSDISSLFVRHVKGELRAIPWSEEGLAPESEAIRQHLIGLNQKGWWTVGSQPALNAKPSADAIFGWGPKNGWVFQKAFVEFFVSPEDWRELYERLKEQPQISFYAGNRRGDHYSNMEQSDANVVTWGIFPGREVAQPTIIEEVSFRAWKDESFAIWGEWEKIYPKGSPSAELINKIGENYLLVTLVHHEFLEQNALWEFLGVADKE
ncbi:methylenetetrahydrofolate reductase 1 [Saitoella coloradoensis]